MAILATEKILTLDYWKAAYHLKPGDYVFDRKGNLVQVTLVQEYHATECYEVILNDYLSIRCDNKAEFLIETPKYRKRIGEYMGKKRFRRPLKPFTMEEIKRTELKTKYNRSALSIPTCDPLKFPTQPLDIPPFVFGFWFFNRNAENKFSVPDIYFDYVKGLLLENGYQIAKTRIRKPGNTEFYLSPSLEGQLKPLIPYLIPEKYLLASEEQRLDLLRGIMIGKNNQYHAQRNTFRFTDRNLAIVKQVQNVCESLGMRTTLEHKQTLGYYTVYFKTKHEILPQQNVKQLKVHQDRRFIKEILEIQPQSCVHIETDGEDGTILVGEGFIACR